MQVKQLSLTYRSHVLLHALHCTAEASREIQAKLEMETHQQADELDIAKDKVRVMIVGIL